jgi:hypothetical protein
MASAMGKCRPEVKDQNPQYGAEEGAPVKPFRRQAGERREVEGSGQRGFVFI